MRIYWDKVIIHILVFALLFCNMTAHGDAKTAVKESTVQPVSTEKYDGDESYMSDRYEMNTETEKMFYHFALDVYLDYRDKDIPDEMQHYNYRICDDSAMVDVMILQSSKKLQQGLFQKWRFSDSVPGLRVANIEIHLYNFLFVINIGSYETIPNEEMIVEAMLELYRKFAYICPVDTEKCEIVIGEAH